MDRTESPEVSIIIPSYKAKDYLIKSLDSIKAHMTGSYEVIVIEDCGEDGTRDMIREDYPWVILVENENNIGVIRTRLHGIKKARGELFFLVDSDIEMLPGTFEVLKKHMDNDTRLGFITCNKRSEDGTHQRSFFDLPTLANTLVAMIPPLRRKQVTRSKAMHDQIVEPGWISTGHSLTRRSAWEDVGGQSQQFFFFGEEIDFCIKLKQKNWNVRFDPHMGFVHYGSVSQRGEVDRFRKLSWKGTILIADMYWPRWQGLVLRLLFFMRGLAVCLKKVLRGEACGDMFRFSFKLLNPAKLQFNDL